MLISAVKLLCVALTFDPSLINGQAEHFRHFFMPFDSLFGLVMGAGTFALISFCLIFGVLL